MKNDIENNYSNEVYQSIGALFAGIILVAIYVVLSLIFSDGKVTYCYIEQEGDDIFIKGNIDWRYDRIIYSSKETIEEVIEKQKLMTECQN